VGIFTHSPLCFIENPRLRVGDKPLLSEYLYVQQVNDAVAVQVKIVITAGRIEKYEKKW